MVKRSYVDLTYIHLTHLVLVKEGLHRLWGPTLIDTLTDTINIKGRGSPSPDGSSTRLRDACVLGVFGVSKPFMVHQ